jgi:CO/xanthine dehydrogenase Mo-binding subunit
MGQGFAIMEDLGMKCGKIRNAYLDTYMIATSMDMPKMEAMIFESHDPAGTYGAKSLGEPATEGVASAIINALHNATKLRFNKIPINKVILFDMLQRSGKGN